MKLSSSKPVRIALVTVAVGAALSGTVALVRAADGGKAPATAKPALTVTLATPEKADWPGVFSASGNIVAWQEAIIGAEANGLRINDVRAQVGDRVQAGQVLATFAPETLEAELAQAKAQVAEAEAAVAEANANADRARTLENTGALSAQQIQQFVTAAKTAEARLAAARALAKASAVRAGYTEVRAPDSGTISARTATVGQVVMGGQELFRMVRRNRLEWRGEVTAAELPKVAAGQAVTVYTPAGQAVPGKVRVIAPTVDPTTRNVQVMVDLDNASGAARAGMFGRGEFALPKSAALSLPQQSVVVKDGSAYVFVVKPDLRVSAQKVTIGRRNGERIEVVGGLPADARVVAKGAGFLNDGDLVAVAPQAATTAAAAPAKAAK
ncbi:MAG: efflux RND transporter periplasmic adaptor subunit [Betaproteobacteria bacterium]|nr:efflux RND transporter periplasmic adaptor subunit [Betaproteobacteria bacterium]